MSYLTYGCLQVPHTSFECTFYLLRLDNKLHTDMSWHSCGLKRSRNCWRFSGSFFFGINLNSFLSRGLTRSFRSLRRCSTQDKVSWMLSVPVKCTMA